MSCKTTENQFKELVRAEHKGKNICFKIDTSERIANFGVNLFLNKDEKLDSKNIFSNNFETEEGCKLVALSGKIGDSIIVSAIYPYKKDIELSFKEYPEWFYKAKVFFFHKVGRKMVMDTMSIEHNPPAINPWVLEANEKKNPKGSHRVIPKINLKPIVPDGRLN